MRYLPPQGLNVPTITVVDEGGCVIEADQRQVFRHVAQSGCGADMIFANGTTGEWNCLSNPERQRLMEIAVDEVRKINCGLSVEAGSQSATGTRPPVEVWLGLNGSARREVRANLDTAIQVGADAAVIAPLAIADLGEAEIVRFFERDLGSVIAAAARPLPVLLYDNPEISAPGRAPHLRTAVLEELSRLPWVAGIKVSAPPSVLGEYTKAVLHCQRPFGLYVGNAMLIFEWSRPQRRFFGALGERWGDSLPPERWPVGVVAGPANVFPREWQKAWRVCRAGDEQAMDACEEALGHLEHICVFGGQARRSPYAGKMIACMKYALELEGVISSSLVARGTSPLDDKQREAFRRRYESLRERLRKSLAPGWLSFPHYGDGEVAPSPCPPRGGAGTSTSEI
jgi:dihydrodipicolinate synthase/N-acetylneuraminate lyase